VVLSLIQSLFHAIKIIGVAIEFVFPIPLRLGTQKNLAIAESENLAGVWADTKNVALSPIKGNKFMFQAFAS
jgi:hypothetical protein